MKFLKNIVFCSENISTSPGVCTSNVLAIPVLDQASNSFWQSYMALQVVLDVANVHEDAVLL